MAGGAGTRLRPMTMDTPKPMLDINGKPFLRYIIEELKKYGVTSIVLCVGYLADKFKEYFGDGAKLGVNIGYSVEEEFLGTAGAIKLAEDRINEDFFVINGDTYLAVDYKDVHRKFKKSGKTGLMVVYDNREKIAEENIAIDKKEVVIAYGKKEPLKKGDQLIHLEAATGSDYRYVDAGVYVFKKGLLKLIEKDRFVSLEGDIYPELIRKRELKAYVTEKRYYDLGTPERLQLIREVLK